MNFKELVAKAQIIQKEMKAQLPTGSTTETRFLVQFKDALNIYQYKANAEGLAKLAKVNFDEVIMVQLAAGNSVKRGKWTKFYPVAVAMLHSHEIYILPEEAEISEEGFDWK